MKTQANDKPSMPKVTEVQRVVCDASGGSFKISFLGYTTNPISYNSKEIDIKKIED